MVEVEKIFTIFENLNPNPVTELLYNNEYQLLVAVLLSAQATDKIVNIATKPLFEIIHTPFQMIELGVDNLIEYIKIIGLYPTKAKNIISLSHILAESFNSEIPSTREDLENLPGIGRKSANVVLNTIFHHPTIAVDTHVFRVSKRLGLAQSDSVLGVERELDGVIPKKYLYKAHHWLVLHGRYICKAKKPLCSECRVAFLCKSATYDS